MVDWPTLHRLGLALGLGLLVGIQRQHKKSLIAGIRTFPLITLFGTLVAIIDQSHTGWLSGAGALAVAGLLFTANAAKWGRGNFDPGLTTEFAALLMYAVGIAIGYGLLIESITVAGVVAVLLQWKQTLHRWIAAIDEVDIKAITQLILVSLVILPVLPNRTFGPYRVLNPFKIWLMVVLIVSISLAAYLAYQLLGARRGAALGGLLGGMISSTATTVSYAWQNSKQQVSANGAALVIMLASTVVNIRVLLEIAVVSRALFLSSVIPFAIVLSAMALMSALMLCFTPAAQDAIEPRNPAQLGSALTFGTLYAVVLFAIAAVKDYFGTAALYGVAVLSGLTDLDAITLSTAEMVSNQQLGVQVGWRVIMVAFLANLAFKAGTVAMLGTRALTIRVSLLFLATGAVAALVLIFWSDQFVSLSW